MEAFYQAGKGVVNPRAVLGSHGVGQLRAGRFGPRFMGCRSPYFTLSL